MNANDLKLAEELAKNNGSLLITEVANYSKIYNEFVPKMRDDKIWISPLDLPSASDFRYNFTYSPFRSMDWSMADTPTTTSHPQPKKVEPTAVTAVLERMELEAVEDTGIRSQLARRSEAILGYAGLSKELKLVSTLDATLARLEIQPFVETSVDEYQEQQREYHQTLLDNTAKEKHPAQWSYMRDVAHWDEIPLQEYTDPIPEFALSKALEIKRELPAAEFFIEELRFSQDPFLIVRLGEDERYIECWNEKRFEATL